MKELRKPNREELESLKAIVRFTHDEQNYWEDMERRRDLQLGKDDWESKISFYTSELQAIEGRFGTRIAVKRKLLYVIGHAHEWLGTYTYEGKNPRLREEMCAKAVLLYQMADETVGFLSDYALRQAEASGMAAKFRRKGGLEDGVTEWYAQRFEQLIGAVLGSNPTVISWAMPENLKRIADVTVDSVINLYGFRGKAPEGKLN